LKGDWPNSGDEAEKLKDNQRQGVRVQLTKGGQSCRQSTGAFLEKGPGVSYNPPSAMGLIAIPTFPGRLGQ
jgi:hypothetical protein